MANLGRPRIQLNETQIEKLAGYSLTNEEIAALLGCSADTLERNYAGALYKGRQTAKASLKRKQFERAMSGSDKMLIWLGKNLLGQSDKVEQRTELSGPDGGPITLTTAEREARVAAILKNAELRAGGEHERDAS